MKTTKLCPPSLGGRRWGKQEMVPLASPSPARGEGDNWCLMLKVYCLNPIWSYFSTRTEIGR